MIAFDLHKEQEFNPKRHVEKVLGTIAEGDYTVACWEPGQISPYHAHHDATEIYFCYQGGGTMTTDEGKTPVTPGSFIVHPRGEFHEYENGPERTLLFRVRFGEGMKSTHRGWRGHPDYKPENRE